MPKVKEICNLKGKSNYKISNRKKNIFVSLILLISLNQCNLALGSSFFTTVEDLPLMAGLEELEGSRVMFSALEGRIIEVAANGKLGGIISQSKIISFYARTLPQLGWHSRGTNIWSREGEWLRLTISVENGILTTHFSLTPK